MHLKSLKVFCDVVDLRSFSRAAEQNGLTQSGASQTVHQLEEHLGVQLLDRSTRPFVPTPEGELYYSGCREVLARYESAEAAVRRRHEAMTGRVRIAAIYSVGLAHMARCVDAFHARHPQAEVRLEYAHPDRVYTAVKEDQADLGLISFPRSGRNLIAIPWRTEQMVLVCAPTHRLAKRDSIALAELDGAAAVWFETGLGVRRELDKALSSQGVSLNVVHAFDNIENIKRAVEIDSGIALLPAPTVSTETEAGSLVAVPLESDALMRPLGIVHRKGKALSPTVEAFIAFLQEDEQATTPAGSGNGRSAEIAAQATAGATRGR